MNRKALYLRRLQLESLLMASNLMSGMLNRMHTTIPRRLLSDTFIHRQLRRWLTTLSTTALVYVAEHDWVMAQLKQIPAKQPPKPDQLTPHLLQPTPMNATLGKQALDELHDYINSGTAELRVRCSTFEVSKASSDRYYDRLEATAQELANYCIRQGNCGLMGLYVFGTGRTNFRYFMLHNALLFRRLITNYEATYLISDLPPTWSDTP